MGGQRTFSRSERLQHEEELHTRIERDLRRNVRAADTGTDRERGNYVYVYGLSHHSDYLRTQRGRALFGSSAVALPVTAIKLMTRTGDERRGAPNSSN